MLRSRYLKSRLLGVVPAVCAVVGVSLPAATGAVDAGANGVQRRVADQ